jgi:hypothetical protein
VTASAATPADARAVEGCDSRASAADALLLYASMLRSIESSELKALGDAFSEAYGEFSMAFNQIVSLAKQLEKAVCKDQAGSAGAQKIKELAEVGRAGLAGGAAAGSQAVFVNVISEQMDGAARCMLRPGERCLSADAVALVNRILTEIRRSRDLQAAADAKQQAWATRSKDIGMRLEQVRLALVESVHSVLAYEEADPGTAQAKRNAAIKSIDKPLAALKDFPEYKARLQARPQTGGDDAETSPIELLVLFLGGTKEWLKNPAPLGADAGAKEGLNVIEVGYNSRAPRPNVSDRVRGLLRQHCGPGTEGQVRTCVNACVGVYGWRQFIPRTVRVGAIKFALNAGLFGWLDCVRPPNSSLARLAGALADLA